MLVLKMLENRDRISSQGSLVEFEAAKRPIGCVARAQLVHSIAEYRSGNPVVGWGDDWDQDYGKKHRAPSVCEPSHGLSSLHGDAQVATNRVRGFQLEGRIVSESCPARYS